MLAQYVESNRTPFAYTIGVHDWGLSELLITAVSPQQATRLLNAVARDAVTGSTRPAGQATCRTTHRDRRNEAPRRAPQIRSCVRRPRNSRAAVGVGGWPRPLAVVSRILRWATTATRARHPVEGCVSEPVLRPQLSDPKHKLVVTTTGRCGHVLAVRQPQQHH